MLTVARSQDLKCVGELDVQNFLVDFASFYHYEMEGAVFSDYVKFRGSPAGNGRVGVFVYYEYYDDFLEDGVEDMLHIGFLNSNIKSRFEFAIHREDLAGLYSYFEDAWDNGLETVKFEIEDGWLSIGDDFKIKLY